MVRRVFRRTQEVLLFFLAVALTTHIPSVFAESTPAPSASPTTHDTSKSTTTSPAPPPRAEAPATTAPAATSDQLKKLQENVGTPAWWKTAHETLDKAATKADAEKLLADPAFTNQSAKDLFRELIWARFIDDLQKVRTAALDKSGTPRQQASRQEILRRINDPNTQLVSKAFSRRPELAMIDTPPLVGAKDDAAAAKELSRLFGRINTEARRALNEKLGKQGDDLAKAIGMTPDALGKVDPKLMTRLKEAAQVAAGGEAKTDFQKAFKTAYDGVVAKNRQTHDLIAKAALGDAAARAQLLKEFPPEEIADYIAMAKKNKGDGDAAAMLKAVADRDKDGNLSVTLVAANAGFGENGRVQTAFLGNEKDADLDKQLNAFIGAMNTRNAVDHGIDKDFDPGTTDGLQLFSIDPTKAGAAGSVNVFAGTDNGKSVIKRANRPGNPGEPLAKENLERPVVIQAPTPAPNPSGTPDTGGTSTGALSNATVLNLVRPSCQVSNCHNSIAVTGSSAADLRIVVDGAPKKFSEVVEKLTSVARMRDNVPENVKSQIRAWAQQQP